MLHDNLIQRAPGLIGAESAGETILVNLSTGAFFGLGQTGATIWKHLEQPQTPSQLLGRVLAEYDVLPEVAAAELDRFLASLAAEQLTIDLGPGPELQVMPADPQGTRLYAPPRLDRGTLRHAARGIATGNDGNGTSTLS